MLIILKMAARNLREHRAKTLIIGSIIALGIAMLVAGNSMIDTTERGVRQLYTRNFTGDLVITAADRANPSLFGRGGHKRNDDSGRIPDYDKLVRALQDSGKAAAWTAQLTSPAEIELANGRSQAAQLFGIDPESYFRLFPDSLDIISGRLPANGDKGICLPESLADTLERRGGVPVEAGSHLLVKSANSLTGTKILDLPVLGIFRFRTAAPNQNAVCLADLETLRTLSGMVVNLNPDSLSGEAASAAEFDEAALFGDADLVAEAPAASTGAIPDPYQLLAGSGSPGTELDGSAYTHVLVTLKAPGSAAEVVEALNRDFAAAGAPWKAHEWQAAAGNVATLVDSFKLVFNLLILVVAIVAVIIIMNTLVISITERLGEIGTMRAIGGSRSFVLRLVLAETMLLALVFGVLGIALGAAGLGALSQAGLAAHGMFEQLLFGGPVWRPVLSPASVLGSLAAVMAFGLLAALYPLALALKVSPVRAMSR